MMNTTMNDMFKRCTLCNKEWGTREDFLADREVRLEGYQWNYMKVMDGMPPDGVLVFTHLSVGCGTSIALGAKLFKKDFPHNMK